MSERVLGIDNLNIIIEYVSYFKRFKFVKKVMYRLVIFFILCICILFF